METKNTTIDGTYTTTVTEAIPVVDTAIRIDKLICLINDGFPRLARDELWNWYHEIMQNLEKTS